MTTVVRLSRQALLDAERVVAFVRDHDPALAPEVAGLLADALDLLTRHPHIGRRVRSGLRELVISKGRTGYVALYRYQAQRDEGQVFAFRHQREAGYQR